MRSSILRLISGVLLIVFLSQDVAFAAGQSLRVPHHLGVVRSSHEGGPETIIQIQDAHDSLEAQEKIAQILDLLSKKYDVRHVALEGSSGEIDPSLFKSYPDASAAERGARQLVKEGFLNAGEFFAATTQEPVAVYGAEEKTLYRENLKAFKDLLKVHEKRRSEIEGLEKTISALAERVYNRELKDLFAGLGEDSFTKKWERLDALAAKKSLVSQDLPHLKLLADCVALEKTISFKKANSERDTLLTDLKARLSGSEAASLLSQSAAYKKGSLSDAEYHEILLKTAADQKIALETYPELQKYSVYAARFESIDIPLVLEEMEIYEERVRRACLVSEDEKQLFEIERTLLCLTRFLKASATQKEAESCGMDRKNAKTAQSLNKLAELASKHKVPLYGGWDPDGISEILPYAVRFYDLAEKRNQALIRNTLKKMRKDKKRVAALVTGGFHSEGISRGLKNEDLSQFVILPKIEDASKKRPYLTILTSKNDKLGLGTAIDTARANPFAKAEDLFRPFIEDLRSKKEDGMNAASLWLSKFEKTSKNPRMVRELREALSGARLAESNEWEKSVFDNAPPMFAKRYQRDENGVWTSKFVHASPAFLRTWPDHKRIAFLKGEELDDFSLYEYDLAKQYYMDDIKLYELVAGGKDIQLMFPKIENHYSADGKITSVLVDKKVVTYSDGSFRIFGSFIDVTKEQEAEKKLRRSEAHLRQALSAAGMVAWVWDMEKDIVHWSDGAESFFRVPKTGLPRSSGDVQALVHPEDKQKVQDAIRTALTEKQAYRMEFRMSTEDGQIRWIESHPGVFVKENGGFTVSGVFMDVTQRKSADMQLLQSEKMAEVGKVAAVVGHEFGNSILRILGHIQLARRRNPEDQSLMAVEQEAQRAASIAKSLLALSKPPQAEKSLVDLTATVEAVVLLNEKLLATKRIELKRTYESGLPRILGDNGQLMQLLLNLVINAEDAISNEGAILIQVRRSEADGGVVLSVRDTGHGMTEEVRPRIFDPYFTTKQKGTGLGLPNVASIASQHNASIKVLSEPGIGTEFIISFPAAASDIDVQDAQPSGSEKTVSQDPAGPRAPLSPIKQVLFVEDEELNHSLLKRFIPVLFGIHPGEVFGAFDVEEALKIYRANADINFIVLDYSMPGINGAEAARIFRKEAENPSLPRRLVISFLSGYGKTAEMDELIRDGIVQDAWYKPDIMTPARRDEIVRSIQNLASMLSPQGARLAEEDTGFNIYHANLKVASISERLIKNTVLGEILSADFLFDMEFGTVIGDFEDDIKEDPSQIFGTNSDPSQDDYDRAFLAYLEAGLRNRYRKLQKHYAKISQKTREDFETMVSKPVEEALVLPPNAFESNKNEAWMLVSGYLVAQGVAKDREALRSLPARDVLTALINLVSSERRQDLGLLRRIKSFREYPDEPTHTGPTAKKFISLLKNTLVYQNIREFETIDKLVSKTLLKNGPPTGAAGARLAAEALDPYEMAKGQIRAAAKIIDLDPRLLEILTKTHRELDVKFKVKMDTGPDEEFFGFRIMHNNARGPGKGGIRYTRDGDNREKKALSLTRALATWMSLKTAVVGIPYGGAKGEVVSAKGREYSAAEIGRITRGYVRAMFEKAPDAFGPYIDIPAPDVGTSRSDVNVMAVFLDEYLKIQVEKGWLTLEDLKPDRDDTKTPYVDAYLRLLHEDGERSSEDLAVITGKPVDKNGSLGREKATGQGIFFTTVAALQEIPQSVLKKLGLTRKIKGKTVSIQGYGNVGSNTARAFFRGGAKVTAISDRWGTLENPNGIDIAEFDRHLKNGGDPTDFRTNGTTHTPSAQRIFESESDIFIPAALEGQIRGDNAELVASRKKIIIEGANGPTTPEADEILEKAGRPVVPDILANSGGVLVSYFEWLQNLKRERWPEIDVDQMLNERLSSATREIFATAAYYKVSLRKAANILAITKIADAELARDEELAAQFSEARPPYKGFTHLKAPETIEELKGLIEKGLFKDWVGMSDTRLKNDIERIVDEIVDLKRSGKRDIRYVLLAGPPTVGKSFVARAIVESLKVLDYKAIYLDDDKDSEKIAYHQPDFNETDIIVAEGNHIFSDTNREVAPEKNRYGIFVNSVPSFKLSGNAPFTTADLRLIAEILYRTKTSQGQLQAIDIIRAWPVERKRHIEQIYPTRKYTDRSINTYLGYELPVVKDELLPELDYAEKVASADGDQKIRKESLRIIQELFELFKDIPAVDPKTVLTDDSLPTQYLTLGARLAAYTVIQPGDRAPREFKGDKSLWLWMGSSTRIFLVPFQDRLSMIPDATTQTHPRDHVTVFPGEEAMIGRSDSADLKVLRDSQTSRTHAKIQLQRSAEGFRILITNLSDRGALTIVEQDPSAAEILPQPAGEIDPRDLKHDENELIKGFARLRQLERDHKAWLSYLETKELESLSKELEGIKTHSAMLLMSIGQYQGEKWESFRKQIRDYSEQARQFSEAVEREMKVWMTALGWYESVVIEAVAERVSYPHSLGFGTSLSTPLEITPLMARAYLSLQSSGQLDAVWQKLIGESLFPLNVREEMTRSLNDAYQALQGPDKTKILRKLAERVQPGDWVELREGTLLLKVLIRPKKINVERLEKGIVYYRATDGREGQMPRKELEQRIRDREAKFLTAGARLAEEGEIYPEATRLALSERLKRPRGMSSAKKNEIAKLLQERTAVIVKISEADSELRRIGAEIDDLEVRRTNLKKEMQQYLLGESSYEESDSEFMKRHKNAMRLNLLNSNRAEAVRNFSSAARQKKILEKNKQSVEKNLDDLTHSQWRGWSGARIYQIEHSTSGARLAEVTLEDVAEKLVLLAQKSSLVDEHAASVLAAEARGIAFTLNQKDSRKVVSFIRDKGASQLFEKGLFKEFWFTLNQKAEGYLYSKKALTEHDIANQLANLQIDKRLPREVRQAEADGILWAIHPEDAPLVARSLYEEFITDPDLENVTDWMHKNLGPLAGEAGARLAIRLKENDRKAIRGELFREIFYLNHKQEQYELLTTIYETPSYRFLSKWVMWLKLYLMRRLEPSQGAILLISPRTDSMTKAINLIGEARDAEDEAMRLAQEENIRTILANPLYSHFSRKDVLRTLYRELAGSYAKAAMMAEQAEFEYRSDDLAPFIAGAVYEEFLRTKVKGTDGAWFTQHIGARLSGQGRYPFEFVGSERPFETLDRAKKRKLDHFAFRVSRVISRIPLSEAILKDPRVRIPAYMAPADLKADHNPTYYSYRFKKPALKLDAFLRGLGRVQDPDLLRYFAWQEEFLVHEFGHITDRNGGIVAVNEKAVRELRAIEKRIALKYRLSSEEKRRIFIEVTSDVRAEVFRSVIPRGVRRPEFYGEIRFRSLIEEDSDPYVKTALPLDRANIAKRAFYVVLFEKNGPADRAQRAEAFYRSFLKGKSAEFLGDAIAYYRKYFDSYRLDPDWPRKLAVSTKTSAKEGARLAEVGNVSDNEEALRALVEALNGGYLSNTKMPPMTIAQYTRLIDLEIFNDIIRIAETFDNPYKNDQELRIRQSLYVVNSRIGRMGLNLIFDPDDKDIPFSIMRLPAQGARLADREPELIVEIAALELEYEGVMKSFDMKNMSRLKEIRDRADALEKKILEAWEGISARARQKRRSLIYATDSETIEALKEDLLNELTAYRLQHRKTQGARLANDAKKGEIRVVVNGIERSVPAKGILPRQPNQPINFRQLFIHLAPELGHKTGRDIERRKIVIRRGGDVYQILKGAGTLDGERSLSLFSDVKDGDAIEIKGVDHRSSQVKITADILIGVASKESHRELAALFSGQKSVRVYPMSPGLSAARKAEILQGTATRLEASFTMFYDEKGLNAEAKKKLIQWVSERQMESSPLLNAISNDNFKFEDLTSVEKEGIWSDILYLLPKIAPKTLEGELAASKNPERALRKLRLHLFHPSFGDSLSDLSVKSPKAPRAAVWTLDMITSDPFFFDTLQDRDQKIKGKMKIEDFVLVPDREALQGSLGERYEAFKSRFPEARILETGKAGSLDAIYSRLGGKFERAHVLFIDRSGEAGLKQTAPKDEGLKLLVLEGPYALTLDKIAVRILALGDKASELTLKGLKRRGNVFIFSPLAPVDFEKHLKRFYETLKQVAQAA